MTQNTGQSYQLPDGLHLAQALDRAEAPDAPAADIARSMCLLLAATVRDILTDHDHDAAFDATDLELLFTLANGTVNASGSYWTGDGTCREFAGTEDTYDLNGWAHSLDETNRETWASLCEVLGENGHTVRYRLDLTRAAAL
ncbi:hypothetical protein OG365_24550 [Streptomyces sp. NBC_00853]|uniref:hypothetical protein n=1 Tax=Streptomyces sp. NBC_00853 TaxID=2903681 RepID=UPI0038733114|nr:hypothetical protein OG365_24550 [Streptomyces sp. NBC_00853]